VVDLEPVTGLPVLFAVMNLAVAGSRRTVAIGAAAAAATVVAMPYVHGDHSSVAMDLARVAAIGCAVAAGCWLRSWRARPLSRPAAVARPPARTP
jgi:hypothetical protein